MDEAAAPQFDPIRHRKGGRPRKAPRGGAIIGSIGA